MVSNYPGRNESERRGSLDQPGGGKTGVGIAGRREFEGEDKRAGRKISQGKKAKTYLIMLHMLNSGGNLFPMEEMASGKRWLS